jgi:hypothetical protein
MNAAAPDKKAVGLNPMDLVEVYTVTDPSLAEIIKAALQRDGIACWIEGENQAGLAGILSISLLTRARDADLARRIVKSYDHRD